MEAARGSFQDAVEAIERSTGQQLGHRQVQELAQLAAVDFEDFYAARRPKRSKPEHLLVLSADGKGIVMRPDALRTQTATRRARAGPKPKTRLAGAEKLNCKRMAEIGAVYDATPAPRTAADILARDDEATSPRPGRSLPTSGCAPASSRTPAPSSNTSSERPTDATPNTAAPGSRSWTATTTRSNGSSPRPKPAASR